jgi:hypothetical protein
MDFSQFFAALGSAGGIDTHAAQAAGICAICFDGRLDVTFERSEDGQVLYLHCPLGEVGADDAPLLASVLERHLFGIDTQDAYFGLDRRDRRLMLFKAVRFDQAATAGVLDAVETFVNQCARWHGLPRAMVAPGRAAHATR